MWKGMIRCGEAGVAIKLYAGVQSRAIGFHLLHGEDGERVRQRMVHPETGDEVPHGEARKGLQLSSGAFVVVEDAELESLAPKPSRDIEITRFVPAGAIDSAWFERPYYLGPDGSTEAYFALVEALRHSRREGVARWTMRGRSYHGALRVHGEHLVLITLRHRDEVLLAGGLRKLRGAPERAPDARELALADQLVSSLEGELDMEAFRSNYQERVLELIEEKARGGKKRVSRAAPKQETVTDRSLVAMLKSSLVGNAHKHKREPAKAGTRARSTSSRKREHGSKQRESA
jgi:DNA end-binding protein Ku